MTFPAPAPFPFRTAGVGLLPSGDLQPHLGAGTEPVPVDELDLDDRVERLGGGVLQPKSDLARRPQHPECGAGSIRCPPRCDLAPRPVAFVHVTIATKTKA